MMKTIVIGGQIDKKSVAQLAEQYAGAKAKVVIKGDIEAAMDIKSGKADLYLGACNTGGGGALAMAIALLGMNLCQTVSMPGKIYSEEEIKQAVKEGKKAFGFTAQHATQVVPIILRYALED